MHFLIANQQHQTNKRTKAETELLDLLNSIYSTTTWVSQCRKGKTSHQHLISQFLQAGRSSCRPTNSVMQRNVMSMWSLRWHFTNKSVTGAANSIKGYSYSLSHSPEHYGEEYDDWNSECRLEVAAELQQLFHGAIIPADFTPHTCSTGYRIGIYRRMIETVWPGVRICCYGAAVYSCWWLIDGRMQTSLFWCYCFAAWS